MKSGIIGIVCGIAFLSAINTGPLARAEFVSPGDFDFKTLLPAPPADHSDAWKNEIDQMLKLQEKRTDDDIKRIESESKLTPFTFSKVLGPWFNPDDLPLTAKFLSDVTKDASEVCKAGKDVFQRPRPYLTDSRLHPATDKERSTSYPSSHSTRAMTIAFVLCELVPDQKKGVMAEGLLIGDDRVLAAQHYPSDVAAGRVLAKAIFEKMMQDPKFAKRLAAAKAECAAKEPVVQASK